MFVLQSVMAATTMEKIKRIISGQGQQQQSTLNKLNVRQGSAYTNIAIA